MTSSSTDARVSHEPLNCPTMMVPCGSVGSSNNKKSVKEKAVTVVSYKSMYIKPKIFSSYPSMSRFLSMDGLGTTGVVWTDVGGGRVSGSTVTVFTVLAKIKLSKI